MQILLVEFGYRIWVLLLLDQVVFDVSLKHLRLVIGLEIIVCLIVLLLRRIIILQNGPFWLEIRKRLT